MFACFAATQQWSCPHVSGMIPGARDGHSACVINGCMYVFGGFEEEIDRFSQDVHVLNFRTMQWSYVCTLVSRICTSLNNKLVKPCGKESTEV